MSSSAFPPPPFADDNDQEEYDEFGDDPLYMLEDAASAAHDPFPAECCVQRAASSRRERYFLTMGKKSGNGGSGGGGGAFVRRESSLSSSSDTSLASDSDYRPSFSSRNMSKDVALQSAADLQREVFPHGVPSQGVLKSGLPHISADVLFSTGAGGGRPWHGFIVDDVLYMYVAEFRGDDRAFRAAVMALMDLAEEVLGCFSVLIALPKTGSSSLAAVSLARAFLYSGFELVSPLLYEPSPNYLLVGYDAM
ncbi:hypothetical protein GGI21_004270 [Coemansia aciculifera]|nr:hypothetical protein GGI21_004270 [Coemansia aciculifera]